MRIQGGSALCSSQYDGLPSVKITDNSVSSHGAMKRPENLGGFHRVRLPLAGGDTTVLLPSPKLLF